MNEIKVPDAEKPKSPARVCAEQLFEKYGSDIVSPDTFIRLLMIAFIEGEKEQLMRQKEELVKKLANR